MEKRGFDLTNKQIDHINRNRSDNRKINLRICDRVENIRNSTKRSGATTSQYKGVSYIKSKLKWATVLNCNGIVVFRKLFPTEREAALAYNVVAVKYFGEFANLNIL